MLQIGPILSFGCDSSGVVGIAARENWGWVRLSASARVSVVGGGDDEKKRKIDLFLVRLFC